VFLKQQAAAQAAQEAAQDNSGDGMPVGLGAPAPATLPDSDTLTLSYVTSYDPLAVCNDGTPAGYYFSPGTAGTAPGSTWLLYLQGGLWCYDEQSCLARAAADDAQISSASWGATMGANGIFATDATDNPFAGVNKVFIPYCSSDAWLGDVSAEQTKEAYGFPWAFRGLRIIAATLTALRAQYGLGTAGTEHRLLLGGCSAGARGAMYVANSLAALPGVSMEVLLDSSLWINVPPFDPSLPSLLEECQLAFALFNASAVLPPACLAAYPQTPYYCLMGQYLMPFLTVPYFLSESQFDAFQLPYNLGGWPTLNSAGQMAYADSFQVSMRTALAALPTPAQASTSGVYSLSCLRHCLTLGPGFWEVQTGGVSLAQELSAWWFQGAPSRTIGACMEYQRCVQC